jgi:hypothetical protein
MTKMPKNRTLLLLFFSGIMCFTMHFEQLAMGRLGRSLGRKTPKKTFAPKKPTIRTSTTGTGKKRSWWQRTKNYFSRPVFSRKRKFALGTATATGIATYTFWDKIKEWVGGRKKIASSWAIDSSLLDRFTDQGEEKIKKFMEYITSPDTRETFQEKDLLGIKERVSDLPPFREVNADGKNLLHLVCSEKKFIPKFILNPLMKMINNVFMFGTMDKEGNLPIHYVRKKDVLKALILAYRSSLKDRGISMLQVRNKEGKTLLDLVNDDIQVKKYEWQKRELRELADYIKKKTI